MIVTAFVLAGVFAIAAGVLGTYAMRCARCQLPFGSRAGLPGQSLRQSERAWQRGHAAAATTVGTAAIISLIQAMALAVSAATPDTLTWGYIAVLVAVGVVLNGMLLFWAVRTAKRVSGS